jgi:3,4-dihydroxy 2-butanone 4-phosphate synthase/GTP cyclohydrolase II
MSRLSIAIEHLKAGGTIILIDDEDRENEGDLVMAAEFATGESVNFMAMHARGLICLALEGAKVDALGLSQMAPVNRTARKTAFTVSIEARTGVTTGISAYDRARTIQAAVDPAAGPNDIVSPGHIFPLRAVEGGVLARNGHTEGSIDLMKIAGLKPAAVICEVMRDDGTMARLPDLEVFAHRHGLPMVTIAEIVAYRQRHETLVEEVSSANLPSAYGAGPLQIYAFRSLIDGAEHLALVKGPIVSPALVRIHSECLTGDALGSLRCDCGPQLRAAIQQISESESGALVYMRGHEGRGVGLANKIKAYALQDGGMDTVEANAALGFAADLRDYSIAAQILRALGVDELRLLTNNPEKTEALRAFGFAKVEQVPLRIESNPHNEDYLATKRDKMGHRLGGPKLTAA